jgi:hypothetical protein
MNWCIRRAPANLKRKGLEDSIKFSSAFRRESTLVTMGLDPTISCFNRSYTQLLSDTHADMPSDI